MEAAFQDEKAPQAWGSSIRTHLFLRDGGKRLFFDGGQPAPKQGGSEERKTTFIRKGAGTSRIGGRKKAALFIGGKKGESVDSQEQRADPREGWSQVVEKKRSAPERGPRQEGHCCTREGISQERRSFSKKMETRTCERAVVLTEKKRGKGPRLT